MHVYSLIQQSTSPPPIPLCNIRTYNFLTLQKINHIIFLGTPEKFRILPLHSQLTSREQRRVFDSVPTDTRKIVLSTNISETSVTINDVRSSFVKA